MSRLVFYERHGENFQSYDTYQNHDTSQFVCYYRMPIQAPQWTDYLNCPVCCREFGAPPRSPISLGCGHTLCRHCLKHLHRKQCPFDQIVDTKKEIQQPKREKIIENRESKFLSSPNGILQNLCAAGLAVPNRYSIQHLAASTTIIVEAEELVVNTALLQLAGYAPPAQPYHPPCVQALPELDRLAYDAIIRCMEHLAVYLKFCGNANNSMAGSRLSRPMQRKLVTLLQCALTDAEGRGRAARAARSLGERTVTELILQHQNPQQLSANLWAAVRARGCQFLGPAMQEEVLKLVLLALEDGSALSRKVLVMFVVQRLEPHFPQASKTSIGHVVQLLYRASCFKVSKRECDSSLMQLKEEFRTYESLRREHDAQIVQIATEAGLRIAPDQWSALLYGDTAHKSHMQSIIDKLQTPQSFAQSVQELFIALQRTGDPAQLVVMSMHLDRLAGIDASPDAKSPTWQQLAEIMTSLKEVVSGLIHYLQQQATGRDSNHNHSQKHVIQDRCSEPASQPSPSTAASTPTHAKYKVSMCRDAATRSFCPRGSSCTFAHSEEELERYRSLPSGGGVPAASNGNYTYLPPLPQNMPMPQNMQLTPMYPRLPFHPHIDNYNVPPMPPQAMPPPALPPEMIPPQEYPEAGHNVEGIQQNYPAPMIHSQPPPPLMNQNGMMIPLADRPPYYGRFGNMHPIHKDAVANNLQYREFPPPVFQGPGNPMYQGQEQIPPIPNIYVSVPHEPPRNISPYQFDDMQSEMMPEYRVKPAYVSVPRERRPDPPWPPANEVFNFEGMRNSLPHCSSSSEDMFNVTSDRRAVGADRLAAATDLSNRADDQELEEELQALERRIDTELD